MHGVPVDFKGKSVVVLAPQDREQGKKLVLAHWGVDRAKLCGYQDSLFIYVLIEAQVNLHDFLFYCHH